MIIILTGTLGTLGFTLLFRMRKRLIVWALLNSCLTTALYTLCVHLTPLPFFQNLFPALFAMTFAEVLARLTKAPTTPYIVCTIIPLVPGGALYYTMYHVILGEMELFHERLLETLRVSAGLAVGILCVSAFTQLVQRLRRKK